MKSENRTTREAWEMIREVLPIALVAILTRLSVAQDIFSRINRPVILWIIGLFNIPVSDHGNTISVGCLEIPWTGDCAGLNLLVLLLAVAIWLNRREPFNQAHWLRILGMIPASVMANVLRVVTLIGYRELFYPRIETPQLHYFFGLVWLIPFALMAMPRSPRHLTARVFELLHVATVVALLAPQTYSPGGMGLTIAVVLGLAHCHIPESFSRRRLALLGVWLLAAFLLFLSGMVSFWLPWLLLCPLMADARWVFSPAGAVLTIAAHPLFALLPGAEIVTWGAIAFAVWQRFIKAPPEPPPDPTVVWHWHERAILTAVSILFLLPFLSNTIITREREIWTPPKSASLAPIPDNGFMVTLPDQRGDIGLMWYNSSGSQRHHTLQICLKYRGVELAPSEDDPEVFTDGIHWFREFFLEEGKLIPSHARYVIATLGPGKSAGVHLIFVANSASLDATEFNRETTKLASQLFNEIMAERESKSVSPTPKS